MGRSVDGDHLQEKHPGLTKVEGSWTGRKNSIIAAVARNSLYARGLPTSNYT